MDPLSAYRQKQQQMKKKKPNYTGLYVGIGAVVLLLVIIWWTSQPSTPPAPTNASPTVTADVKLSESQKRRVYASTCRYREMLTNRGGTARRAYEIVAEQNNISVTAVLQIEAEGMSKHWPRE